MSDTERKLRDRARRAWENRHRRWGYQEWPDLGAPYTYYWDRTRGIRVGYTTGRMFDGRFWTFKYVKRQSGSDAGHYVLVRCSIVRRAKRKDAKAKAEELWRTR